MFRAVDYFFAGLIFGFFASETISQAETIERPSAPPAMQLLVDMRIAKPLSRSEESALKPQDMFKECEVCPEMIVVPAGRFWMGSPQSEDGSDDSERPQREVIISNAFAVGRFAVTFDEWDACVAAGGCRRYRPGDRGWGRGPRPAINLRWEDARAYGKWLSETTGRTYRLLSEAEREYVARAGTTTAFWWGNSISSQQANYDGTFSYPTATGQVGEFRGKTLPVDSFVPNPWGLYQVHGNIFEWVEDCWHKTYHGAPTDGSAWTEEDCERRVLRGGAYNFAPSHLRSASRGEVATVSDVHVAAGTRVARSISTNK